MILLEDYLTEKNINNIDFLKIDTEGYEYETILGLRNNSSSGKGAGFSTFGLTLGTVKKQPIIIRPIGERWGLDRVEKPAGLAQYFGLVQISKPSHKGEDVIKSYFNTLDDVASRIVGRTPSVFADRYFADIQRINGVTNTLDFLANGSIFVNAQINLQKQNPFERMILLLSYILICIF